MEVLSKRQKIAGHSDLSAERVDATHPGETHGGRQQTGRQIAEPAPAAPDAPSNLTETEPVTAVLQ